MIVFAHELTYYIHGNAVGENEELKQRLVRIIDLGVKEHSCICSVDQNLNNFVRSKKTAYQWFKDTPQEAVVTVANVVFVDPISVLEWYVFLGMSDSPKIQPLNHYLWLIDVLSLDSSFQPTTRGSWLHCRLKEMISAKFHFPFAAIDRSVLLD